MQTPPPPSDSRNGPFPVCDAGDRELFFEVRGYRIARCRRCGFRYVNPRPSEAALLDLYAGRGANPFTDPSFEAFEDELPGLRDILARLRRVLPQGRLLELGCGRGDLLRMAVDAGYSAEGCDLYGGRLPECPGVTLHDGFLRALALPAGRYDAVLTRNTLEHLIAPLVELREIHRIVRPGGWLYVKVPNVQFEVGLPCRLVFGRPHLFDPPWHLNHFDPNGLRRLLARAGFTLEAWGTEIPTRSHVPRRQRLRQLGYWVGEGLRIATAGRLFPKPVLVCLARRAS